MSTGPQKRRSGDPLGVERTTMANERTLLAYVRTALAFLITGASALHFIEKTTYRVGGVAALIASAVTALAGFIRYLQLRRRIRKIEDGSAFGAIADDED